MVKNLHHNSKENKLIMGRHILIDIYKGEYEIKGKVIVTPSSRDSKNRERARGVLTATPR